MKNNLENLELKLLQTRKENAEKLDKIETKFKKEFSSFFDILLENDNLWFKRFVSVYFQLEKLDNENKDDLDILTNSINKALEIFPINKEKKVLFEKELAKLIGSKDIVESNFLKISDLHKNHNFPILWDLERIWFINNNDLLKVSLKYKESKNFLESIKVLEAEKFELIKSNYFELNDTNKEERIENFSLDFKEEISNSKVLSIYPKVLKFIWKNYSRLRLKNKVESKKDRLRRMFKIAFLKLYRLKYSGIDINSVLNKIDSLEDLDEMLNLLLKFFEVLKQNPNLQKDYIVSEDIDEINELETEAEENKEKILFSEKNTIKASEVLEKADKYLTENDLEELLWENVDLVWENFILRKKVENSWIYENENDLLDLEQEDEELEEEINIEEYYEELKIEYDKLEKKKLKLFLNWEYDLLDKINEELLNLLVKLEKLEKIIDN